MSPEPGAIACPRWVGLSITFIAVLGLTSCDHRRPMVASDVDGALCSPIWIKETSGTNYSLRSVWGSGPGNVFVATSPVPCMGELNAPCPDQPALVLHYDGTRWTTMPLGADHNVGLTDIWGSGPGDVWAVGSQRKVYRYDGSSWTRMSLPGQIGTLTALWGRSSNDLFAISGGAVVRFDGTKWTQTPSIPKSSNLHQIWSRLPNEVFVAASTGVLKYDGTGWTNIYSKWGKYKLVMPSAIWGSSDGSLFVGSYGGVFQYGGSGWAHLDYPGDHLSSDIWASGPGDIFVVTGFAPGAPNVLRFDGARWTGKSFPTSLNAVWGSGPTDVFAVGDSGAIYHYCCPR
jgi:hypothetical protein